MMSIAIDRRHAFYLDADDQPHPLPSHSFDRLWCGEPDAAMPELGGQRVRFAVFHVERFTSPPRVVTEHYPALILDSRGHVDVGLHQAQLHAEVVRLEANDYMHPPDTAESHDLTTTWRPNPALRRRLLAALTPSTTSYRSRATLGALRSRTRESRFTYPSAEADRILTRSAL